MVSGHVFRYGGNVGTHLIIGGVDVKGPQLIEVDNGGNVVSLPYLTMGSGCLAAMGVMESSYREGMSEEEAKNLCITAIEAIFAFMFKKYRQLSFLSTRETIFLT